MYLDPSSPSFIPGFTIPLFNQSQFWARADAGGEGGVIFDSSIALTQGLFPPTVRKLPLNSLLYICLMHVLTFLPHDRLQTPSFSRTAQM